MITPINTTDFRISYRGTNSSAPTPKRKKLPVTPQRQVNVIRTSEKTSSHGFGTNLKKMLPILAFPFITLLGFGNVAAQNTYNNSNNLKVAADSTTKINQINFNDPEYIKKFKPIFLNSSSKIPENIPDKIKNYLKANKGMYNGAYIGVVESNEGKKSIGLLAYRSLGYNSKENDIFDFIFDSEPTSFYDDIKNKTYKIEPVKHPDKYWYLERINAEDHQPHVCINIYNTEYNKITIQNSSNSKSRKKVKNQTIDELIENKPVKEAYKRSEKINRYMFTGDYVTGLIDAIKNSPYRNQSFQNCKNNNVLNQMFKMR